MTNLLTPLLALIAIIFGVLLFGNKKSFKLIKQELDKLNERRAAEKEHVRRAAVAVEKKRRELEKALEDIGELDMDPGEAGDDIRDRYGPTRDHLPF